MTQNDQSCLLFDIDGTLVDSDRLHIVAMNEICGAYGVSFDEETFRTRISGRMNNVIFAEFLPHVPVEEHADISNRKEALFRTMASDMKPLEGLMELLDWADSVELPYAAVTNAPRENAHFVLRALNAMERFKAVILSDELDHAKPHPLPYLTGLQKLAGSAHRSVAFEDSKSGVTSAHGAGLSVVGLTTSMDSEILRAHGAVMTAPDYRDAELLRFVKEQTGRR